ncbi:MAG: 16S rRNA (uracil(1498)-N(3))-methyltransferase [Planctomycetota bacterium]
MARRYFIDELPDDGGAVLVGDTAHHLATVLRVRPGDAIVLADGRGGSCEATVERVGGGKVALQAGPIAREPAPAFRLHVAFAPPRWTRADWLFEHGTELGVTTFWPLWTERTRPQGGRTDRWDKLIRAAAGQCDRSWLPEVRPVTELAAFLADPALPERRFVGAGDGSPLPAELDAANAALLVGPEGGFTAAEQQAIAAAGFAAVSLGPHVLRTETAALVGAAALGLAAMRAAGSPPPRS